ncbi:MAG: protein translocase subunit SecDF, partial [Firmicutes bacterium]|nr:protein translocase subunit SecDF [Bacillota bacterium]
MSANVKKLLAALVLVVIVLGWYFTCFGAGSVTSVKDAMKYGLDINGGVYVVMEAQTDLTGDELKVLMDQTRAVLDNRVNQLGVSESSVTIEGDKRIRVEIPGVEDAEDAIEAIGRTALLQFVLSDGTVIVDGSHVKDAGIATD